MSHRIGVDLGGTKISGVMLDDEGTEVARTRQPTPRDDYSATLDAIARVVADLEDEAGLTVTVGVGTPGAWQPRLERMKNCNSTWLNDRPLLHDLEHRLGNRVRLANDADCLAVSEAADGAGAGSERVFAVILGTGVGGGMVNGGVLARGPNGLAGEWGHMPLPYFRQRVFAEAFTGADPPQQARFRLESRLEDRRCYCGRLNCIETFLSGPGLAATHAELWRESLTTEAIAAQADDHAAASFEMYQHMLARSLAQVVNLMDPDVIVAGGGLSNVARLFPVQEALIPAYTFSSVRGDAGASGHETDDVRVSVRPARWGDDSGVRGAARLWDAAGQGRTAT